MSPQQASRISKVKALLAKTTDAGCSEHEALAALELASRLMDQWDISEAELELTRTERAIIFGRSKPDPKTIRYRLCFAISYFTDTKCWRSNLEANRFNAAARAAHSRTWKGNKKPPPEEATHYAFCGLQSDVDFANYLLDSLETFCHGALMRHLLMEAPRGRQLILDSTAGFVDGITSRISERLRQLKDAQRTSTTKNALVIFKRDAIDAAMRTAGIDLRPSTGIIQRTGRAASFHAGVAAGDRASFARPVDGASSSPTTLSLTHRKS